MCTEHRQYDLSCKDHFDGIHQKLDKLDEAVRGNIDFGVREQNPCATRLEHVPFAWWCGEVKVASGS
jgi:hypothetical protein